MSACAWEASGLRQATDFHLWLLQYVGMLQPCHDVILGCSWTGGVSSYTAGYLLGLAVGWHLALPGMLALGSACQAGAVPISLLPG